MSHTGGVHVLLVAGWLLIVSGSGPALAAGDPQRVPQGEGLFGSPPPGRPEPTTTTSVGASVFQGYDGNLFGNQATGIGAGPLMRMEGPYSGIDSAFSFNRDANGVTLAAGVESSARYHPQFKGIHMGAQSARLGMGRPLWRSARLVIAGDGRYSNRFGLTGGPVSGLSLADFATDDVATLAFSTFRGGLNGQIQQDVGRRKVVTVSSNTRAAQIDQGGGFTATFGAGLSLAHQVGRHGSWRASYSGQEMEHGSSSRRITHDVSLEVGRNVPLSLSRQARYFAAAGSTVLDDGQGPRYRLSADMGVSYDLARRWIGSVRYTRGVGFIDELPDPLLFDALAFEIGLAARRLAWSNSGALQRGGVGLSDPSTGYDMYSARSKVTISLSRRAAVYGEYFLRQYRFGDAVRLPIGLSRIFERQGARVGVQLQAFVF